MSIRSGALVALLAIALPSGAVLAADPSAAPASSAAPAGSAAPANVCPPLTTKPMSAEDAAAVDNQAQSVFTMVPDLPGMWIGIWDPAKGFYTQAYGSAVTDGAKAAIDQHGRIGSITKTFTITAVLQQVAAGTLKLESTIGEVLPDLATKYPAIKDITVEQLAGMTSGIQDYANTGAMSKELKVDVHHQFSADDLIDSALTLPLAAPGTGGYSTTNTIILGKMLEKVTGKPVGQVVTELAAAAGMKNTALPAPGDDTMPDPSSHGYVESMGQQSMKGIGLDIPIGTDVTDWTVSWGGAGGAMYSTVADMGIWASTGLGTCLLPADLAAKRLAFKPIPEGQYGLGILSFDHGWIGHTGQIIGWEAITLYNTETGAAFVGIVNETGSLQGAEIVAVNMLPDLLKLVG